MKAIYQLNNMLIYVCNSMNIPLENKRILNQVLECFFSSLDVSQNQTQ